MINTFTKLTTHLTHVEMDHYVKKLLKQYIKQARGRRPPESFGLYHLKEAMLLNKHKMNTQFAAFERTVTNHMDKQINISFWKFMAGLGLGGGLLIDINFKLFDALRQDIKDTKAELTTDIHQLDHKVDANHKELQDNIHQLDHKIDANHKELQNSIHQLDKNIELLLSKLRK